MENADKTNVFDQVFNSEPMPVDKKEVSKDTKEVNAETTDKKEASEKVKPKSGLASAEEIPKNEDESESEPEETPPNKSDKNNEPLEAKVKRYQKSVEDYRARDRKQTNVNARMQKKLAQLYEDGEITQDLLEGLKTYAFDESDYTDVSPKDDSPSAPSTHPLAKYATSWDSELEALIKYSSDSDIKQKYEAFSNLVKFSTAEDLEYLENIFSEHDHDSVSVTKKMLEVGQYFNDTVYRELQSSGGLIQFAQAKNEKIDQLEKLNAKLKQKIMDFNEENGYTKNKNYNLPFGKSSKTEVKKTNSKIDFNTTFG